jgi:hypothetical protein
VTPSFLPRDTTLAVEALYPYPSPARLEAPGFCPLHCGFLLTNDWDGHFLPCLLGRAVNVWYTPGRADLPSL